MSTHNICSHREIRQIFIRVLYVFRAIEVGYVCMSFVLKLFCYFIKMIFES